jgi:hypothetical protein
MHDLGLLMNFRRDLAAHYLREAGTHYYVAYGYPLALLP